MPAVTDGALYEALKAYVTPLRLCTVQTWGRDDDAYVIVTARGSAELLVAKGFAVPRMFENLPRCGQRSYGGKSPMSAGLTFGATVQTTNDGYRVQRSWQGEELDDLFAAMASVPGTFSNLWERITGKADRA